MQGFIEVEKILPRWDIYATLLPQSARVSDAIVDVYEAVVLFSVDSIRMLRKSPLSMTGSFFEVPDLELMVF